MGGLVYLLVLGWIWLFQKQKPDANPLEGFNEWHAFQDNPNATPQDYLQDRPPRSRMTRLEKTGLTTALASIALYYSLVHWQALREL